MGAVLYHRKSRGKSLLGTLALGLSGGLPGVDLPLVEHGENDGTDSHHQEDHGDGGLEDIEDLAVMDVHEADEVLLAHGTQDQGQQNGGEGELVLVHEPAEHAEGHAHANVEHALVNGERAQQGDDQDDRVEHGLLH